MVRKSIYVDWLKQGNIHRQKGDEQQCRTKAWGGEGMEIIFKGHFIYLFILSDQNVLNLDCSNGFTTLDVLKPFE